MGNGRQGMTASRAAAFVAIAACCAIGSAFAGDAASTGTKRPASLPPGLAAGPVDVETVSFPHRHLAPVRLVRGRPRPPRSPARHVAPLRRPAFSPPRMVQPMVQPMAPAISTQIVSFGYGTAERVTVIRGGGVMPASLVGRLDPAAPPRIEKVSFADPAWPTVTVLRGPSVRGPSVPGPSVQDWASVDLFGPPDGGILDRLAFAVDWVESRHGTDMRMWRPEPNGPQGPMQVTAAAAFDVGGGDRFDLLQNRLLGRAYLAQMFQRYGNWPDALAAYNWGPGSMDQWIAGGRNADQLPFGVARYVDLVLRHALITNAGR